MFVSGDMDEAVAHNKIEIVVSLTDDNYVKVSHNQIEDSGELSTHVAMLLSVTELGFFDCFEIAMEAIENYEPCRPRFTRAFVKSLREAVDACRVPSCKREYEKLARGILIVNTESDPKRLYPNPTL